MLTRRCPPRTALLAIAALLAMLLIDPPAIADSESAATGTAAASSAGGAPFEGFGVSGAWWARDTGHLPDRVRGRIARLLFAPSGLHLSQYRYNIGGGGAVATAARFAPGYLRRSGAYDWAADPAGRDMLRRAAALGVGHLVAFANAAPPAFTTNGRGCGGSLRSDRVAQYAAYLARVVSHLSANGTPIDLVSPMNEPDSSFSSCNQEGMTVPVSLRARLIQAVQAALARRGSAAGVLADESGGAGALLREAPGWLAGAGGSAQPAAVAYHAYDDPDAGRLDAVRTLADAAARPAYMSEVCCMVDGHFRRGFHPQMRGALWVARAIWRNLALGGASSFSWWVALSPELGCDARQASCGRVSNRSGWDDGLIYYDRDYRADGSTRLVLTKRYWAYAQFSRWVRPGMRPHVVTGDTGGAKVLVFAGRGHTVVLAVAPRKRPARFSLQLPWIGSATAAVSQTSTDRNDAPLRSVGVNAGVLGADLPKGSVTTFVLPGS